MYISVEKYEEMYLLGKSPAQLSDEINKIRREIARAKNKLESPANVYDNYAYPGETSAIDVYRAYLDTAMNYYAESEGVPCDLTEEEKASLIFDSSVSDISCITLTVGRYLQDKYELTFSEGGAEIQEIHLGEAPISKSVDAEKTRRLVFALHIGEWKENYTPEQYGCTINEPTKWQLRIDYSTKSAPRFYDGVGVFPYNFEALAKLLGADII